MQGTPTAFADHCRLETRRRALCLDVGCLLADVRYPADFAFPGLKAIRIIQSDREREGMVPFETRFYVYSTALDLESVGRTSCGH
jgi:hypothetical protein